VVILAFTQSFFVATHDLEDNMFNHFKEWQEEARSQFLSTVQDPEGEWFEKEYIWCFYWLRTIIVLIIMMTLLIAVVVSNYEQVARSMDQQQYLQMCEIIIEQETFMVWNKNKKHKEKNLVFTEMSESHDEKEEVLQAIMDNLTSKMQSIEAS
jgi:hypothetical protein